MLSRLGARQAPSHRQRRHTAILLLHEPKNDEREGSNKPEHTQCWTSDWFQPHFVKVTFPADTGPVLPRGLANHWPSPLDIISARNEIFCSLTSNGRRMGRYKDYHREPRREGFNGDQWSDNTRASINRSGHERAGASQAPEPVDAIVKWFNAEKGFGFVEVVGGSAAFMHVRQLEAAGHRSVTEGARVKVRIRQGQKGPEVTQIVEVLAGSVAVMGSSVGRTRATPSQVTGQVAESMGTVKVYKTDKGFGFVGQDGGGKDVFVHVTALARAGLSTLVEGQRVRMQIGQGQKGLEAQTIELLE